MAQDLSAGTAPSESLEAEIVVVRGAEVTGVDGRSLTADYGSARDVSFRVADGGVFCVGATFGVIGVVTEWADDSVHRVLSYSTDDVTSLDTTPCGSSGRAPAPGELLINEYLADPPDVEGDANCDGYRDGSEDEFLEIVNVSTARLSLSGVRIHDEVAVRHSFSTGTSLEPGAVVLVFGGGAPSCYWPSGVEVQIASTGFLGLNNSGDTITLVDEPISGAATTIAVFSYGSSEGGAGQSLTLDPDLDDEDPTATGIAGFVEHSLADTVDGSLFSPGTRVDGSPL
jgi:hypothetical protein